jgi:hypothetical protein
MLMAQPERVSREEEADSSIRDAMEAAGTRDSTKLPGGVLHAQPTIPCSVKVAQ